MAHISRSVAVLRIGGDKLDPEEITNILGCEPNYKQIKGQVFITKASGRERIAKTGAWNFQATDREPENLDEQISEILDRLNPNSEIWKALSEKYHIDLFCGIFMEKSNEGMEISPSSLMELGSRGIQMSLDIYDGDDKPVGINDLCPCDG